MASLKKARTVFQLESIGTWFENIAVRSNGLLLATRVDAPEVWQIDPTTGTGSVVVTFPPPITGVTGITELTADVFAIGAGQYNAGSGTVVGSWEIHLVDFASPGSLTPTLVTKIPEAGLINGLATWDENTVLAADSEFGALYKVDVGARSAAKVLQHEEMTSPAGAPMQIGINGVKVRDGHVYFSNSMRQSVYRVAVNAGLDAAGPVETLASGFMVDDFALDADGTVYGATHPMNTIVKIVPGSPGEVIAGNVESLELAAGTACAFGRGKDDGKTLYVVTAGALVAPVKGELREPAKVAALDLS